LNSLFYRVLAKIEIIYINIEANNPIKNKLIWKTSKHRVLIILSQGKQK